MRKEKGETNDSHEESLLEYIRINHKNKIEELSSNDHVIEVANLIKILSMEEDGTGGEINKFFQSLIPESKEGDPLKMLFSISSKAKYDKDYFKNCINEIMNRPETTFIILTKDLSQQLSIVLKEIFKIIKKSYSKIKTFNKLVDESQKYLDVYNEDNILQKYKVEKPLKKKNDNSNYIDISFNNSDKRLRNVNINNNYESGSSTTLSRIKISQNLSAGTKVPEKTENETFYQFKKNNKEDSKYNLPIEMIILIRKFNMIKKLRLILDNNSYSENNLNIDDDTENNNSTNNTEIILDQNDLYNNILVLLNLEWLFPSIVELEVDLTNENLVESEIKLYLKSLKRFSKLLHKDIKITTYQTNSFNKRYYDPIQKSLFSQNNQLFEDEHSSDKFSSSLTSNTLNYNQSFNQNNSFVMFEEKGQNMFEKFIKKYKAILEMIIIYGYFIRKMTKIIKSKFIIPLNLGDEIFELLKMQKIYLNDFHFLSFLNNNNIIYSTIDFNSLDNQTFGKVLNFLNQNQQMNVCNLSFFPPEEYFKTELLFKLLQSCDTNYRFIKGKNNKLVFNKDVILDIKYEDLDDYILKKLSKYFEKNLSEFFYLLTIKGNISELSLIFDIPTILTKNGYYNNILMKFFLDLFIFIDNSLNNIKTLRINAENFIFDSRKNPILNNFCDKLSFYLNDENKLTNLTFQARFYNINNIYRLIPYNLTYLSLGSFDYNTFYYFVYYLTSSEFNERSKLNKLKINLNNSVIEIDKVYDSIIRLYTEYPKGLSEISLYTHLCIKYKQLTDLLMKTNYNTLDNIFIEFNLKSILNDKELEKKLEYDLTNVDKEVCIQIDNLVELYRVKRNKKLSERIIGNMMLLGKKNKDIMKYNIYSNIEKFLCPNEKKIVIIQFKR